MQFLKGLVSKFKDDNKSASVQIVADRFKQLFTDHGVELSQIPRIFPKVSLEDLKSDDALLKRLNPELLDDAANFFSVRVEWLEGEDDRIYPCISNYKQPQQFFDLFNSIKYEKFNYPVRLVTSAEKLDFRSDSYQPIIIMLAEKIAEIGEKNIYRYYIDTEWSWNHSPCRLQLKAIGYLIYKKLGIPMPIFKIEQDTFNFIAQGEKIPFHHIGGCCATNPSLEDFVLLPSESRVSKEAEDIPDVIQYIEYHELNNCIHAKKEDLSEKQSNESVKEKLSPKEKAQKAASAKNKAANEIKQIFVTDFSGQVRINSISRAKAAQTFYDNLNPEEEKQLARSLKDYEKSTSDEVRLRGIRTLENAMRLYLKQNL